MRKLATGAYAALLVLLVAAPAAAQAAPPQYESSEPSDGATVHEPPDRIEVTFDQPLDDDSELTVTDECDRRVDDGATEVSGSSMSVALEQKPSGHFHVEYLAQGIGGITGENEGHFTFTAHGGPSCDGSRTNHNNHGNGNGNGNNHNNGHGNGTGNDHGNRHGDGDEHATGHSTGTDHASGAGTSHGGHDDTTDQAAGKHSGGHDGDGSRATASGDFDGITSSDTARRLLTRANSTTLLISLALCVALGILGGTVLRATSSR